jgi:hypothetical protein
MACLRVRCGSSVYVQKKSCSLTSSRGGVVTAVSVSGDDRRRGDLPPAVTDEVTVDAVAGILGTYMPVAH